MPDYWFSDEQWLAWSRDWGLDLLDRDQLLDSAAVGLSVLCWRNTVLEDVHAGGERAAYLEQLGTDLDDPAEEEAERERRRSFYASLDADFDNLANSDPDESRRIGRLLDGRQEGFGIPDDVMMRLNISTAVGVRQVLAETVPLAATEPGAVLSYDRRALPEHLLVVVEFLQDPDRAMVVGGTSVTAGEILGDSWDEYESNVIEKITLPVRFADRIGARRALWYTGLSGHVFASSWYPNPFWNLAVNRLRAAVDAGDPGGVYVLPDRPHSEACLDSQFWSTLLHDPAALSGPQCEWVQETRLQRNLQQVREEVRATLGPLPDGSRFSPLAALF